MSTREYGRIENSFWVKMHGFSDGAKLLAAYLKSNAHANSIGAYLLPDAYIADDLKWPPEKVSQILAELLTNGFCARFADGRHIVVRGFIAAQPPENPNVVKSMIKHFEKLPSDPLLREVSNQILAGGHKWVPEEFRKSCENPSERVSERLAKVAKNSFRNPEPYPEPDPEPVPEPEPDARSHAGVREAPAPLARVQVIDRRTVIDLTTAVRDWAEDCEDARWLEFKRNDCPARDWDIYFHHCRPNGSSTTLLCPTEASRKILEHRFSAKAAARFGEPVTFKFVKLEIQQKEATT